MNSTKIYTISELNREVKSILEESFTVIEVTGEISNLVIASSGHSYFSLKDNFAQVQCVMFRAQKFNLLFEPKNGLQVTVCAQVSLYEGRGTYQLITVTMKEAGDGLLQRAFEALKNKLHQEGLFDTVRKRPLPSIPRCIGIITSPTGAAIRDILSILKRRFANIPIIIYPTLVQGKQAAEQIVSAINIANKRQECEVLILARGGGSLEDLWPFNEESVARSIYNSTLPIVSAVGHEIDFTIADFVADCRAATPSAAAELLSPASDKWLEQIYSAFLHLQQHLKHRLSHLQFNLEHLKKRLRHPAEQLRSHAQQLDYLEQRLCRNYQNFLQERRHQLAHLVNTLQTVNPLNTLQRGYAIVIRATDGTLIQDAREVEVGDKIIAGLKQGSMECLVEKII